MIRRKIKFSCVVTFVALTISTAAYGLEFALPPAGSDTVGIVQIIQSAPGDTLADIGIKYDMGANEMRSSNPRVPAWGKIKPNTRIIVPARFVLPSPRDGVVINLAELRLYYYPKNMAIVDTFPIGVGREGWETPIGTTKVIKKVANPRWIVPASIFAESERLGKPLKPFYEGGPHNPLGLYAIYLDLPGIRIHGTTAPRSVGREASHGCIRMLADDIKFLYDNVPVGTPVYIIYEIYRIGWEGPWLYLEAETPFTGYENPDGPKAAIDKATKDHPAIIDEQRLKEVLKKHDGIPTIIGHDSSVEEVSREDPPSPDSAALHS